MSILFGSVRITNCILRERPGEPPFWFTSTEAGELVIDRYACLPREDYEAMEAEIERLRALLARCRDELIWGGLGEDARCALLADLDAALKD